MNKAKTMQKTNSKGSNTPSSYFDTESKSTTKENKISKNDDTFPDVTFNINDDPNTLIKKNNKLRALLIKASNTINELVKYIKKRQKN